MNDQKTSIKLLILLILILIGKTVVAQVLSGVVKSTDGEGIPFASIYIKELTSGTTSNLDGEYSINLTPGKYTISFQALGFTKVLETITIGSKDVIKNIELKSQDYKIKEVRVYSGNEDPAYGIIRKSISLAPYFLRQVKHYKANVYLKGGFDMNKVPRLFRKQLKEEGVEQGKSYVAESINEIIFNSPNKFEHHLISKRSTIPNDSEEQVLGYLNYSFYDSDSELAISPLSRRALSFYKYRYDGFFQEGDYYINKIKVIPKRKNQKLFEGYIYIVDNLWNLHSVDLVNEQFFGKIRVKQVQAEVKGRAWLPVSHQFDVEVKTFGFNATANYGGSVKYEEVILDDDLPVPSSLKEAYAENVEEVIEEEDLSKPLNKNQKKIEELLKKNDLNNREMLKLSRLMEKENESVEAMGQGLQLESLDSTYKIIRDTVPADSIDWNKIRPIPLSKKEIESFGIKDSLTLAMSGISQDSIKNEENEIKPISVFGNIIGGKKYVLSDSTRLVTFRHYGVIDKNSFGFNAVDGWLFIQNFNFRYYLLNDKKSRLDILPSIKYAINRKAFNWNLNSTFNYDFIKHTVFSLHAGQWSKDFNEYTGISDFANAVSSLLFKENYQRLYQDNFIEVGFKTDIANALIFKQEINYQYIEKLENTTNYSISYNTTRNYTSNNNIGGSFPSKIFESRKGFQFKTSLQYTPEYYYRIDGERKKMIESDYPTFTLSYEKGLNNLLSSESDYDVVELAINQELEWSFMYEFSYNINAGYYLNNSSIHFSNYTHFNTSEIPISFKDWKRNFNLLDDYKYSTNQWYVESHLCYSTPYLLVKNIPFLQEKLWNENLYLHHLSQPNLKNYNEVGYGISQIFLMMNIGVFAGFDQFEFNNWQFKISLNLDD